MKNYAPLILVLVCLSSAAPAWAQTGRVWDASQEYKELYKELSNPETTGERPLKTTLTWSNAPFLRLRAGDEVFAARRWHESFKSQEGQFADTESVFLRAEGRVWEVGTIENGSPRLRDASALIFFDWDVTLKNAVRLRALNSGDGLPISLVEFHELTRALKPDFPDAVRDASTPQIAPAQIVGSGASRRAVFETLRYIPYRHTVEKERAEIGRGLYRVTTRPFIVGPARVERAEFEPNHPMGINGPAYNYSPENVARKRAGYGNMKAFEARVEQTLPRVKHSNP